MAPRRRLGVLASKKSGKLARPGRGRLALIAIVLLAWLGLAGWAALDVGRQAERTRETRVESLESVARTANLLFQSEEDAIDGVLSRLRLEFRAQGAWNPDQPSAPIEGKTAPAVVPIDERRLRGLMHRAIADSELLGALDLVIAGHDGLSIRRVERDGTKSRSREWSEKEREANAKALWYAEEVRRAVTSRGRRIERGELVFEGEIPRPLLRVAVGLHEASEVVQAVVVGSVDLSRLATRMAVLSPANGRVTLVNAEGRALDPARAEGDVARGLIDLAMRIGSSETPSDVFEAGPRLVLGTPLANRNGGASELLLISEVDAPASGWAAWRTTPWPAALVVVSFMAVLALAGLIRSKSFAGAAIRTATTDDMETVDVEQDGTAAPSETFLLREWLADIRGCLERDAASRGLSLDLRCERAMPDRVVSDSAWLGGLVLAMGREALDAAAEDRVLLEVFEDAGETLRFEVDAGGASLAPIGGMSQAANRVGGRLETMPEGRLALVVPAALG